jgi:NAD+ synthase
MQERIDNLVKWIRTQVPEGGKAVLGISGGKDSTIAAALCVRALGAENVVGVLMPNGVQPDINDSVRVCDILGIEWHVIDIGNAYYNIVHEISCDYLSQRPQIPSPHENNMIKTNLPARLRMATLYAVAALYPNSRVVNTCNYSEDYVGYSTKYGDAAGDFSPLGGLTVREVLAIGDALELPYDLVHKAPSDGMCGKTDEDNLGFTYEQLDDYIDNNKDFIPVEVCRKIEHLHKTTRHKYHPIPTYGIYGEGEEQL